MRKESIWVGVATALPTLLLAAAGWFEARTEREKKFEALDSYGEYVTDRLQRDEALERALNSCMAMLHGEVRPPAEAPPGPERSLDEVAEDFGYDPSAEAVPR